MGMFAKIIEVADREFQPEMHTLYERMTGIYQTLLDEGHSPDVVTAAMIGVGIDNDVERNGRTEAAKNLETMAIVVAANGFNEWKH